LTASLSTAVRAAAFSFAMISAACLRREQPIPALRLEFGQPASADVRKSGSVASRTVEPTTSPFTNLSLIDCETDAAASQTPSICPPIASSAPARHRDIRPA